MSIIVGKADTVRTSSFRPRLTLSGLAPTPWLGFRPPRTTLPTSRDPTKVPVEISEVARARPLFAVLTWPLSHRVLRIERAE